MKRLASVVLTLAILLSIFTTAGSMMTASASTNGITQNQAVEWIKARGNEGWWADIDGAYQCQCVDLILAYYDYLVGYHTSGNAYQYASNALPAGWYRDYNPTPGSIIVWAANSYAGNNWSTGWTGHIGLVYAVSGSNVYTVETNLGSPYDGAYGQANAQFKTRNPQNVVYIHPDFAQDKFTFDVNAYLDGAANNNGVSGLTFDVYINGSKAANDVTDFCDSYSKGTTYKVDDVRTSGALIYTGSSSFSGTINSDVEVKLPVKTGLTVKSHETGMYSITIPANYSFAVYDSETATKRKWTAEENKKSYTFICTDKFVLSDGSTRYRYTDSGVYKYFTFASQMKAEQIILKSTETGTYKVTIPSNYDLHIYTSATALYSEYHNPPRDYSYTYTCDTKYTYSDGTVRYSYLCGDGKHYCFYYASCMTVSVPLTVKSQSQGLYKVTIPANYKLLLYASATDTDNTYYSSAKSSSYSLLCADKYVMSDGSTRYGYYFSPNDYRIFTLTSQMKAEQLTSKSETGTYKVTVPAGYELHLYTSGTASYTEYYIKAKDSAYTYSCDKKLTFSDGCSVRYGYSNSSGKAYFFDFASGMTVDEGCAHGHTFTTDSTKLAKAATCCSPAYYYKRCSKCGEYSTETFAKGSALGHSYTASGSRLAKEATCTSAAVYYKQCSRCGEYSSSETFTKGEAPGHAYTVKTVEPTCTASGYKIYTCSRCSYSYVAYTDPATGHKIVKDAAVEATCTHTGKTEGSHCLVCNKVITAQQTTPVIDHADRNSDGKCDSCGLLLSVPNPAESCDCICHSDGPLSVIWNILMKICRILGINDVKYCDCGKCHF